MHSDEVLALAMKMAGINEVPRDTMIYVPGKMKKILFGIDIDLADVMFAKELGYDGVIGHHPIGLTTRTHFFEVMNRQKILMQEVGASEEEAEEALKERREEIELGGRGVNYDRHVTAFKMLGMPVMNVHIVIDIISEKTARDRIYPQFPEGNDKTVGDLIDAFMEFEECKISPVKPKVAIGKRDNPCGLPIIAFANGTFGGPDVLRTYWKYGRDTAVYMHVPPKDIIKLREDEDHKNLILTGHMPSDSIGINVFIDALIENGMEVDTFNGVVRPE
jgi:hypothetical protein